jgi:AcrR family transcriptional regulator
MHPDDRRDALIAVFLDLAHREGRPPTTSEIAREAGVAEGTIFRAFATKDALQEEAVQVAFCPAPVRRSIAAIGDDLSVRDRLVAFTTIMQRRFTEVFGLMSALGLTQPPNRGAHLACYAEGHHLRETSDESHDHTAAHQPLLDAIHALLLDSADDFVVPARDVVHRIRLLCFSGSHPGIADGDTLTPDEIVDTVLFGLVARPTTATSSTRGSSTPGSTGESGLSITALYEQLGGDTASLEEGPHPAPEHAAPATPPPGIRDKPVDRHPT